MMKTRTRFLLFGLGILCVGATLFFFLNPTPPEEPASPNPAKTTVVAETTPTPETVSAPETQPEPTAITVTAADKPQESVEPALATGSGRIHGTLTTDDGAPLPGDLAVVVSRYPETTKDFENFERFSLTAEPNGNGAYEVNDIPYGSYSVFVNSETSTGNSSLVFSHENRDQERDITLYPAAVVAGVVVNTDDEPIPNAYVYAAAYVQGGREVSLNAARAFGTEAVTDEQGNFVVRSLQRREQPLNYRLLAIAEDYANHTSPPFAPGTQDARLVLGAGIFVSGYAVHSETGDPVPDITLLSNLQSEIDQQSAKTSTEGWFILGPLGPGSYEIGTEDKPWVVVPESATLEISDESDTDNLTVALLPGGTITGRVYDADTDRGIAGAEVRLNTRVRVANRNVQTDANGEYTFEGLLEGSYRIYLRNADGYPPSNDESEQNVEVTLARRYEDVDFDLRKGITVSGRVEDTDGAPVALASVRGSQPRRGGGDSDDTDDRGRFILAGYASGQKLQITATKDGLAAAPLDDIEIADRNITGLEIVMVPEATISGTVVNSNGNLVKSADIFTRRVDGDSTPIGPNVERSKGGSFKVGGLMAGSYRLRATQRTGVYVSFSSNADESGTLVTVGPGEQKSGVQLKYDGPDPNRKTLSISGRVVDEDYQPIAGATLMPNTVGRRGAASGRDGAFKLTGLRDGRITLHVQHREFSNREASRQAGDQNVVIVMKRNATISGRVVDRTTGKPVTEFETLVQKGRGPINPYYYSEFKRQQNRDGSFTLKGVQVGNSMLAVRANGYAKIEIPITSVGSGEDRADIVVQLEGGSVLTGHVYGPGGEPVRDALLFANQPPVDDRGLGSVARSVADGSYRAETLPSGSVTLYADHSSYARLEESVTIVAGAENRHDIHLRAGGGIEGYVTHKGEPLNNHRVLVRHEEPSALGKSAETNAEGYYKITGLPDGAFEARAFFQPPNGFSRAYTGEVAVTDGFTEQYTTRTGEDGTYRMEDVTAGDVKLRVSVNGYAIKWLTFSLAENETARKDVDITAGATLNLRITNMPPNTERAYAYIVQGEVQLPALPEDDFFGSLGNDRHAGYMQLLPEGAGSLPGLEPGAYTVIALVHDDTYDQNDRMPSAILASRTITVTNQNNIDVSISF